MKSLNTPPSASSKVSGKTLTYKRFLQLHEHCDANTLGCSEELFEIESMERALEILNAAQDEVNLWLIANSIKCRPNWNSIDMDVESHSAAFRIKHGRQADCYREESVCNELWFDEIYLKIRALVKERTGK